MFSKIVPYYASIVFEQKLCNRAYDWEILSFWFTLEVNIQNDSAKLSGKRCIFFQKEASSLDKNTSL